MSLTFKDPLNSTECECLQQEERQVIESIYPGYSSNDDSNNVLRLEIPIELSSAMTVIVSHNSPAALISTGPSPEVPLCLSSLPPIRISMILPRSYPLTDPPCLVSVRATHLWLSHTLQLQMLLAQMWRPGEGVLYTWIEFIRTGDFLHSLSLTSLNSPPILRLSISHPSPQVLIPLLQTHERLTKSMEFSRNTYACSICLTSLKGSKCIQLMCGHIFCRSCLEEFWKLCIAEGDISRVGCPDPECVKFGREANIEDVMRVVTQAETQRYQWLKEKAALEKDPSVVHCPMSFCQNPVAKPNTGQNEGSGWERLRICSVCSFSFCVFCKRTWHGPITSCPIAHSEKLVLDYLALPEDSSGRRFIEGRFGKTNVLKLVATYKEEQANKEWLQSYTMACPGCQVHVEKSLGCNHMTCAKCRQHFCYRCGTKLPAGDPYSHFSTKSHPCYNKLFDFQAEDEDWQPIEGFNVI